ncbi:hypothetical protein TWF694_008135 [Orbilia ellipsospora]|uniref:WSC domain-containing protein n=1 Tax=Orbilia ellipsospora TaxID=2528407 RepID=A0AAV9XF64_9PEZI
MRLTGLIASTAVLLATSAYAAPASGSEVGLLPREPATAAQAAAAKAAAAKAAAAKAAAAKAAAAKAAAAKAAAVAKAKAPAAAAAKAPPAPAPKVVVAAPVQPKTAAQAFPPDLNGKNPWKYTGCYADSANLVFNAGMCSCMNAAWKGKTGTPPFTMAKCIGACRGAGFRYAGIKGDDGKKSCWCGSGISDDDKLGTESKCDVPCRDGEGDTAQGYDTSKCGGRTQYSVWASPCYNKVDPDTAPGGYQYQGCFFYSGWGTILPVKQTDASGDNLSIDSCLEACSADGYAYAGMTAGAPAAAGKPALGNQCYCGGRIAPFWITRHLGQWGLKDGAMCTSLCSNTAKVQKSTPKSDWQYCGAYWYMSIYFNPDLMESDTCPPTPTNTPLPTDTPVPTDGGSQATVTVTTPGPNPGTTTIPVTDGNGSTVTNSGTVSVIITTPTSGPSHKTVTVTTPGPEPGTSTVTGPNTDTVIITTPADHQTVTVTTPGPEPGTTTKTGPSTDTVIITTPADHKTVTVTTPGPSPGTTTKTGPSTDTVIITTPSSGPSPASVHKTVTVSTPGPSPGTSTKTGPSTDTVIITCTKSGPAPTQATVTETTPGPDAGTTTIFVTDNNGKTVTTGGTVSVIITTPEAQATTSEDPYGYRFVRY